MSFVYSACYINHNQSDFKLYFEYEKKKSDLYIYIYCREYSMYILLKTIHMCILCNCLLKLLFFKCPSSCVVFVYSSGVTVPSYTINDCRYSTEVLSVYNKLSRDYYIYYTTKQIQISPSPINI